VIPIIRKKKGHAYGVLLRDATSDSCASDHFTFSLCARVDRLVPQQKTHFFISHSKYRCHLVLWHLVNYEQSCTCVHFFCMGYQTRKMYVYLYTCMHKYTSRETAPADRHNMRKQAGYLNPPRAREKREQEERKRERKLCVFRIFFAALFHKNRLLIFD